MQHTPRQSLVHLLVEEPDPVIRSRAHAELGSRALSEARHDKAAVHFQEALALDPTDEVSRSKLERLNRTKSGGVWSRWLQFRR